MWRKFIQFRADLLYECSVCELWALCVCKCGKQHFGMILIPIIIHCPIISHLLCAPNSIRESIARVFVCIFLLHISFEYFPFGLDKRSDYYSLTFDITFVTLLLLLTAAAAAAAVALLERCAVLLVYLSFENSNRWNENHKSTKARAVMNFANVHLLSNYRRCAGYENELGPEFLWCRRCVHAFRFDFSSMNCSQICTGN